jgi:methylated-DNA-protein-cysteine methyltransferase-like protein
MDALSAAERIFAAIRAIPRGETAAYGVVAQRAGLPGRARMVARLLSLNDDPALPWHRVLRSDGRSAFPPGSAQREEQLKRLRREGVRIDDRGRVRAVKRAKSLDEEIWG